MYTKDPSFYRRFFSIRSVLVRYNIITLGVNLADNVMIGTSHQVFKGIPAVIKANRYRWMKKLTR